MGILNKFKHKSKSLDGINTIQYGKGPKKSSLKKGMKRSLSEELKTNCTNKCTDCTCKHSTKEKPEELKRVRCTANMKTCPDKCSDCSFKCNTKKKSWFKRILAIHSIEDIEGKSVTSIPIADIVGVIDRIEKLKNLRTNQTNSQHIEKWETILQQIDQLYQKEGLVLDEALSKYYHEKNEADKETIERFQERIEERNEQQRKSPYKGKERKSSAPIADPPPYEKQVHFDNAVDNPAKNPYFQVSQDLYDNKVKGSDESKLVQEMTHQYLEGIDLIRTAAALSQDYIGHLIHPQDVRRDHAAEQGPDTQLRQDLQQAWHQRCNLRQGHAHVNPMTISDNLIPTEDQRFGTDALLAQQLHAQEQAKREMYTRQQDSERKNQGEQPGTSGSIQTQTIYTTPTGISSRETQGHKAPPTPRPTQKFLSPSNPFRQKQLDLNEHVSVYRKRVDDDDDLPDDQGTNCEDQLLNAQDMIHSLILENDTLKDEKQVEENLRKKHGRRTGTNTKRI